MDQCHCSVRNVSHCDGTSGRHASRWQHKDDTRVLEKPDEGIGNGPYTTTKDGFIRHTGQRPGYVPAAAQGQCVSEAGYEGHVPGVHGLGMVGSYELHIIGVLHVALSPQLGCNHTRKTGVKLAPDRREGKKGI